MAAIRLFLASILLAAQASAACAATTQSPPERGRIAAPGAKPEPNLGYDFRGQLVPQPRLAVNLFALSDEAASASKAELKAFGRWMAIVVRIFTELDAHGGDDVVPLAMFRMQAGKQKGAPPAEIERLQENERNIVALIERLKALKAPRAVDPDLRRAYVVTARDAAQVAALFEQVRANLKSAVEESLKKDQPDMRAAVLAELHAAIELARWAAASTGRQMAAAVGGTPDLWLWQSQIEGNRAMQALASDIRHVLETNALPPPAGRARIDQALSAMAEWNRRGEIQARHELSRASSSLEPSMARSRWLERVYRNYERTFAVERAYHAWLSGNVPRFYDQLVQAAATQQGRARVENWQQYQALNAQEWALLTERYELLAEMP